MKTPIAITHNRTRLPLTALDKLTVAGLVGLALALIYLQAAMSGRLIPPLGSGRRIPWLANTEDWVGLNYYTREHDRFDPRAARIGFGLEQFPDVERNPLGWEIYPKGLERALVAASPGNGREVIVTENGIPEPDESETPRGPADRAALLDRAHDPQAQVQRDRCRHHNISAVSTDIVESRV